MKFAALVLVMFLAAVSAAGQGKQITEAEYKAAMKAAYAESEKLDRRVTTWTDSFAEGRKTGTEILVEEFQSPDKVRTVVTERSGKKVVTTETVEVDNAKYIRNDSGTWAKWHRTKTATSRLMGVIPPDEPKEKIEYYSRTIRLNRKPVTIYLRASNKAYGFLIGAEIKEIWVDNDNRIVRVVLITSEDTPDNIVEKSTTLYSYAPKGMKIEAPPIK